MNGCHGPFRFERHADYSWMTNTVRYAGSEYISKIVHVDVTRSNSMIS